MAGGYSYTKTLEMVLRLFNPQSIFEWGPGGSTVIMANHPSVKIIDTIEDKKFWYEKFKNETILQVKDSSKVHIIHQPDLNMYPHLIEDKYDLIFVDGGPRVKCLNAATEKLKDKGIVILHDAERREYKEGYDLFKYKLFTDGGGTLVLTNNKVVMDEIKSRIDANII